MKILHSIFLIIVLAFSFASVSSMSLAVEPDEVLADPVLEKRARAISANLRCLVCQNQSIDDSNAPLAADLRVLVRERLVAGDSDVEVVEYTVARYGEYVLLKPVFKLHTILLWAGGPLILFIGLFFVFRIAKKQPAAKPVSKLSKQEQAVLDSLKE